MGFTRDMRNKKDESMPDPSLINPPPVAPQRSLIGNGPYPGLFPHINPANQSTGANLIRLGAILSRGRRGG